MRKAYAGIHRCPPGPCVRHGSLSMAVESFRSEDPQPSPDDPHSTTSRVSPPPAKKTALSEGVSGTAFPAATYANTERRREPVGATFVREDGPVDTPPQ